MSYIHHTNTISPFRQKINAADSSAIEDEDTLNWITEDHEWDLSGVKALSCKVIGDNYVGMRGIDTGANQIYAGWSILHSCSSGMNKVCFYLWTNSTKRHVDGSQTIKLRLDNTSSGNTVCNSISTHYGDTCIGTMANISIMVGVGS